MDFDVEEDDLDLSSEILGELKVITRWWKEPEGRREPHNVVTKLFASLSKFVDGSA
jgi:hypothetical protein